jgi:predicted MFS family arabinose efflux permease
VADAAINTPIQPARAGSSGLFAAFAVAQYGRLWAGGWFGNLTRPMSMFICTYTVNALTDSSFLVQAVGAFGATPMFLGGALGGVISDRLDRKRTILAMTAFMVPVSLLLAAVNFAGSMQAWMVYPFIFLMGIGGMLDMTTRRAMVYDFVGDARATNAVALESLSMTLAFMVGAFAAGAVIDVLGTGEAFLVVALCYGASCLLIRGVAVRQTISPETASRSLLSDLPAGFRYTLGNPVIVSILGVVMVMNLFYFPYQPLVPVFADLLEVNALLAGVLASASAFGSLIATLLIARGLPLRRGVIYVGGATMTFVFLFVFSLAGVYPLAVAAIVLTGAGSAGYMTMLSVLVMVAATPEMRGRALGIASMTIGLAPVSMLALGVIAEAVGASAAVAGSATIGIVAMLLVTLRLPEARRIA